MAWASKATTGCKNATARHPVLTTGLATGLTTCAVDMIAQTVSTSRLWDSWSRGALMYRYR